MTILLKEWNRQRQQKQARAVNVIQREWKHFVKLENNRKQLESVLVTAVRQKEQELEESMVPRKLLFVTFARSVISMYFMTRLAIRLLDVSLC